MENVITRRSLLPLPVLIALIFIFTAFLSTRSNAQCPAPSGDCSDSLSTIRLGDYFSFPTGDCSGTNGYYNVLDTLPVLEASHTVIELSSIVFGDTESYVWIDWDGNSVFDTTEKVVTTANMTAKTIGTVVPPPTASTGFKKMRIIVGNPIVGPYTPCGSEHPILPTVFACYEVTVNLVTELPPKNDYCPGRGNLNCSVLTTTAGAGGPVTDTSYFFITRLSASGEPGTGIDNFSGCDVYGDYTQLKTTWNVGTPYTVHVESDSVAGTLNYQSIIYIDWNNDFDFDDAAETFPSTVSRVPHDITVTPPAHAASGIKRMRVRTGFAQNGLSPCGSEGSGEVEDYSVMVINTILPGLDCVDENTVVPADSAVAICTGLDSLRWGAVTDATGYKVTLYANNTSTLILDNVQVGGTAVKIGPALSPATQYKWIATATNAEGEAVGCDTMVFTTAANADPVAIIIPGQDTVEACEAVPLNLDGNPSLGTAPYTAHNWNGISSPNTNLSAVNTQAVVFTGTAGLYKYVYRVRDNNNCFGTDTVVIRVNSTSFIGSLAVADNSICEGQTTTLTLSSAPGVTINWEDLTDVHPWQATTDVSPGAGDSYNLPALFNNVSYRAIATHTASGCSVTSNIVEITVSPQPVVPVIVVTQNAVNCEGDEVILYAPTTDNVAWNDAGNTQNDTLLATVTGTYIATITTSEGCSLNSAPTSISFSPRPPQPAVIVTGNTPACEGDVLQLTAFSTESIQWNDANNTVGYNLTVTTTGVYIATATNSEGCQNSSVPQNIVFNSLPAKPVITVTANSPLCEGDAAVLTSSYGSGNTWSNGSTTSSIVVTFNSSYTVTHTDPNGCGSIISDAVSVNFEIKPPKPVITQTGNMLKASTGNSYQWFDNNGFISGATSQAYSPPVSGEYRVVVYSPEGCSSDTSLKYSFIYVGIAEQNNHAVVSIYPNPAKNELNIAARDQLTSEVDVYFYNSLGQQLFMKKLTSLPNRIDVSDLARGMYFLRIVVGSSQSFVNIEVE